MGTFWLVLGGCGSAVLAAAFPNVGIGLLGVALAFGLTVLTMAYAAADAAFVQPFDDLKLLSNIAVGWAVFGYLPEGSLWLGVAMILAGSSWLLWSEQRQAGQDAPRAPA